MRNTKNFTITRKRFLKSLSILSALTITPISFASIDDRENVMKIKNNLNSNVDRLYILNGGLAIAPDQSMYTPGKFKDKPITLTCNAYLIHRKGQWILWDTGINESVFEEIGGKIIAHGIRGFVVRPLVEQLADIGLTPQDIDIVILSHAHFDHVGNAHLFQNAKWYIQEEEYRAMFSPKYEDYGYLPQLYDFLEKKQIIMVNGDLDIFGDTSIRIISTPGHTPGHCSLMVRLKNKGIVILSADVAHYKYNLEHLRVPQFNSNIADSIASMKKIEQIIATTNAKLWLNHDIKESGTKRYAPAFYE